MHASKHEPADLKGWLTRLTPPPACASWQAQRALRPARIVSDVLLSLLGHSQAEVQTVLVYLLSTCGAGSHASAALILLN